MSTLSPVCGMGDAKPVENTSGQSRGIQFSGGSASMPHAFLTGNEFIGIIYIIMLPKVAFVHFSRNERWILEVSAHSQKWPVEGW